MLIIFSSILFINCGILFNNSNSLSNISGIVKIKNYNNSLIRFTHKDQRNSIKALPIIISTGFSKDSSHFTYMEFKAYNKEKPVNYNRIEMYNAKKHKWEWSVSSNHKKLEKKKYFTEEKFNALITSKEEELYYFFNFPPVYLKFIGDIESFKKLENKHLKSLKKILKYAKNLDSS